MMTQTSEIPFILCVPWENRNLVCLLVVFQSHSYSQLEAPCLETVKALQPQGTTDRSVFLSCSPPLSRLGVHIQ